MTTSKETTKKSHSDLFFDLTLIACQIRFLSETIPLWLKDASATDDARWGLESYMENLAEKTMAISEDLEHAFYNNN